MEGLIATDDAAAHEVGECGVHGLHAEPMPVCMTE